MQKFVDLMPVEQERWRVWARCRRSEDLSYREILKEIINQGVKASIHSVMCWCDEEYRRKRRLIKRAANRRRYATDPEYRKKQHQRVAARRKVRRATDPAYCQRTYRKNADRRRAKAAAQRARKA